ncbi:MAG TPA: hypothetical protein VF150_03505, partial [Thermoanaerobaculia bacterium]
LATCQVRSHERVAAGDGFWAVWSESCPGRRVRARRLDARARPAGPVIEIGDPFTQPGPGVAAAGRDDGSVVVAWAETVGDVGRKVLWTELDEDGGHLPGIHVGFGGPELGIAAAALPDGGAAFAWSGDQGRLLVTRFPGPDGPLSPVVQAAIPAGEQEITPRLAVASGGLLVLAWSRPLFGDLPPRCPVRVFGLDLEPVTEVLPLAEGCLEPTSLAVSATGAVLATWVEDAGFGSALCHRALAAAPDAGVLPPPVEPIASPEYPDFRFRVRIGGDEPQPRIGSPVLPCLPETVCVSGALPGRTEVLLRVVGPKPNGFLWPTIVRFTTSQVEVWIDQLSSGVGRYYRLAGSSPGSESLDGEFDRGGFPP